MQLLLPTAYLPPGSYVAEAMTADRILIEACETYRKQTLRNHCHIYGPNGLQKLVVPVLKVNGNHTLTKDIRISDHQPWQRIHWRSIETAYSNSPFFLYYRDHFIPFYERPFHYLLDLNLGVMEVIFSILRINREMTATDAYVHVPDHAVDLRSRWNQDDPGETAAHPAYQQVFSHRQGFLPDLSIIDVLFNLGPETRDYLVSLKNLS